MFTTRMLCPCVLAATLLTGTGAPAAVATYCPNPYIAKAETVKAAPTVTAQLKPLADLLAKGEGNYDSINRGYAGDTPGGMSRLTGRHLTTYTVAQVMQLQRTRLYAVGRYQFIPRTLRFAVNASEVNRTDKFDETTQDRLMAALIAYKRPYILAYLQGSHDNLGGALDDLAREWASVEYRGGRSYYRRGGNRAHISRTAAAKVLQAIKKAWNDAGQLP